MTDKLKKTSKKPNQGQQITELTQDLQRTRADFENYIKRCEIDVANARENGQASAILKLLPIVDNIERAISHTPVELKDNVWVQGVVGLSKNLDKSLEALGVHRIQAKPGIVFDPNLHEAILMDENAEGEHEVVESEMQAGYTLNGRPIRHAMVKVTRK